MIGRNEMNSINCITADKQLADSLTKRGAPVKTFLDIIEKDASAKLFNSTVLGGYSLKTSIHFYNLLSQLITYDYVLFSSTVRT